MLALSLSCCVCLDILVVSCANTISAPLTTGIDCIVICHEIAKFVAVGQVQTFLLK